MLQKASSPTSGKARPPEPEIPPGRGEMLVLYRKLMLARLSEEKIRKEYGKDEMKTPVHLGIGEEAIPVGICHVLPVGTKVFGTYRNHALYLAMTEDTNSFFGELYGKIIGTGRGKAGSMHLAAPERGLVATSAVVGTTIPLAVGAALANAYRQLPDLVVSFFGDGAAEEGVFWESLNFACLHRLKVLFICEDNGLAIHTVAAHRQGFSSLLEVVKAFDCHSAGGDGADLLGVVQAGRQMLSRMQADPKPGFLHFSYFRFLEHVGPREDFDVGYRRQPTPEEIERLDPVLRFEKVLKLNEISVEETSVLRRQLEEKIQCSVSAAREAPFPPPAELYTDLFA